MHHGIDPRDYAQYMRLYAHGVFEGRMRSVLDSRVQLSPDAYVPGTPEDDTLAGTAGDDTIDGGAGADHMTGDTGDDIYIVDNTGDVVVEAVDGGSDTVWASVSYTLAANVETLVLTGSGKVDGTGNDAANLILGNMAKNTLDGGAGIDTLVGGGGNDVYRVTEGDVTTEFLDAGIDTVKADISWTLAANIEKLVLTGDAAINGTGSAQDNFIKGNDNGNVIDGGAGNDDLRGRGGLDEFVETNGDGNDTINGGGKEWDILNADWSAATDDIVWVNGAGAHAVNGNLITSVELMRVVSGSGNDVYDNSAFETHDVIDGGAGNDSINSGEGHDLVLGGAGNDTLSASGVGNSGSSDAELRGGDGDDTIYNGGYQQRSYGEAGNDTMFGGDAWDFLFGGDDDDFIDGGGWHDYLSGDNGNDTLMGGDGTGEENLYGGNGDDLLMLGSGGLGSEFDVAGGGDGNDTLVSGGSMDELTGGGGADVFSCTLGSFDTVTDFASGTDHVMIDSDRLFVGNGDGVVDGGVVVAGSGEYAASAELVILTTDIPSFNYDHAPSVAAALGSASSAYAVGQSAIFVVHSGAMTQVWYFEASNNDAVIDESELYRSVTLRGVSGNTVDDFLFGG